MWGDKWEDRRILSLLRMHENQQASHIQDFVFLVWSRRWGSNPRPAVYETAALPAEPRRHFACVTTLYIVPSHREILSRLAVYQA